MRPSPYRCAACLVALSLIVLSPLTAEGDLAARQRAEGLVRLGLERSPHDYLAGQFEALADPACESRGGAEICLQDARIVELYSSRGNDLEAGETVTLLGEVPKGSKTLGFMIPALMKPKAYGGTYVVGYSADAKEIFVEALRTNELEPRVAD